MKGAFAPFFIPLTYSITSPPSRGRLKSKTICHSEFRKVFRRVLQSYTARYQPSAKLSEK
jgi:hypothetical protein